MHNTHEVDVKQCSFDDSKHKHYVSDKKRYEVTEICMPQMQILAIFSCAKMREYTNGDVVAPLRCKDL